MSSGPTWADLFTHWRLVVADLHERFAFDADDAASMHSHSWLWLRDRVFSLLSTPPGVVVQGEKKNVLIPSTRIQWALFNPDPEE